ncbi:MAG TPA: proline dehydrogenase family protein [Rhodocyclaceae bacterium]
MSATDFEHSVRITAQRLYRRCGDASPSLQRGLQGALLRRVATDDALRGGLFQFIDTLPQLADDRAIAEHLQAALKDVHAGLVGMLLRFAARPLFGGAVRWQCRRLARQFLAEESAAGIEATLATLSQAGCSATVDAVGEAVLSEAEADAYLARNLQLLEWLAPLQPRPHLSLKLTALTPRFDPLDAAGTRRRVFARLAPLVQAAAERGATLTLDMEQYELKSLILQLFLDALVAFPDPRWQPAIALQAYLPETGSDIDALLSAAERHGRRLGVRLVKGAYWDQEQAWAAQRGWPVPTLCSKSATDAHYEALTARLLAATDRLQPAIASHNLRSQAVALSHAAAHALKPEQWEMQMLQGMAEPLRQTLVAEGAPLRVYVPTGDLEIGIAYLIRRLLENTAGSSVLRQTWLGEMDMATLIAAPVASDPATPTATSPTLPLLDFSRPEEAQRFAAALGATRAQLKPADETPGLWLARNPARPNEVLGAVPLDTPDQAIAALEQAHAAQAEWAARGFGARAAILRRAADLLASRRRELAALQVLEVAKPWREADADVAEAVDFLRYYATQAEAMDGWHTTINFPGEENRVAYGPRGTAVVIAPWNFPLAILAGMSSAALVTGNAAVMKPALPALLVARAWREVLLEAGAPAALCPLLAGEAEVGAALVAHPQTDLIAFTGSRAVGQRILQIAHTPVPGQRHVKQVICEMGGKNAIVVDADADLDEAVAGIVASAFGYSGQKCSACSRVIAHAAIHDRLAQRLAEAAAALAWGPPEDPAWDHGPLISQAAQRKAIDYIAIGSNEARLLWQGNIPNERANGGWYVAPTIFVDVQPQHRIAREEIFGPVLAILRAPDFASALAIAQDSDYGLTGGVYSRLPEHLALAEAGYGVGNLYLNKKITGARVGIQPFGGRAWSGTGVQAGGSEYLKQFVWSRCVSVNTMRHGFIPAKGGGS